TTAGNTCRKSARHSTSGRATSRRWSTRGRRCGRSAEPRPSPSPHPPSPIFAKGHFPMPVRIYRAADLKAAGVPFHRVYIGRLEKRGEFPKRFHYGANSVAWVADEVDRWVQDKIARRSGAEVVPLRAEEPPPDEPSLNNSAEVTPGQIQ